jgi:hypothetical protein
LAAGLNYRVSPIAEMMALIGYDLLLIDMEHGPVALSETADMMRGIARTDAAAVVKAAKRARLKLGTVPSAGRGWTELFKDGFDIVLPSADISLLRDAAMFRHQFG